MSITTMLFVPADRPERFAKAAASGADAVILDLEDAVAPEGKAAARENAARSSTNARTFIRINPASSDDFPEDVSLLARAGFRNVMLSKAETPGELERVVKELGETVTIVPLIETAVGLSNARELAAHRAVPFLAFGSLDFALDLGCEHTHEALRFARQTLVYSSRLARKAAPIDGVTAAIDDAVLINADASEARSLGFAGKLLIHPKQIAPVRQAFQPSETEMRWAKQVLDAVAQNGTKAVKVNGQMVDRPVMSRAERILSLSASYDG
ncbi:HpcH/HpaI aldolase (plasmid) [Rhizobium leguminosarum bv. trifolii WSM2304]|uniref:HpcH/HpaI aldolase n=1 Tax=Rhizobium leguminosarum bv. trifolii (strain WSM2304) TaxID=395492 RepID=A0ABF7QZ61_RHILW|nr:CoA ester lyase [Rhizobium leguminosarum]ACI59495.1 HpcH/HpaI aldolase [Rhizobium leguminosarum bv. trifolii WSM2304]